MPRAGFEPTIPASERLRTLDHASTGIRQFNNYCSLLHAGKGVWSYNMKIDTSLDTPIAMRYVKDCHNLIIRSSNVKGNTYTGGAREYWTYTDTQLRITKYEET